MPSTTIHFPDDLLQEIDRSAKRHKMSRNKYVIEACKSTLSEDAGEWPEGFFSSRYSKEEEKMLQEAATEMENAIYHTRRNRGAPAL